MDIIYLFRKVIKEFNMLFAINGYTCRDIDTSLLTEIKFSFRLNYMIVTAKHFIDNKICVIRKYIPYIVAANLSINKFYRWIYNIKPLFEFVLRGSLAISFAEFIKNNTNRLLMYPTKFIFSDEKFIQIGYGPYFCLACQEE